MAFYKKQYSETHQVYYPQAVVVGKPVQTKEIAAELASISTVSRSDVMAVLGDLAPVLAKFMKQGKSVHIDGLGTFRYTLKTEGVKNEEEFNFAKQKKGVRVQFIPETTYGSRGNSAQRELIADEIEWIELSPNTPTEDTDEPGDEDDTNEPNP